MSIFPCGLSLKRSVSRCGGTVVKTKTDNYLIVECPRCGVKNRILHHYDNVRPICGKCQTPLPENGNDADVIEFTSSDQQVVTINIDRGNVWKSVAVCCFVVAALLVCYILVVDEGGSRIKDVVGGDRVVNKYENTVDADNRRLQNAQVIKPFPSIGFGEFKVINGTSKDAAVKLVDGNRRIAVFFYVRANSTATMYAVSDGVYKVFFQTGYDWDSVLQRFTKNKSQFAFDKDISFRTYTEERQSDVVMHYQSNSITLHKIPSGNVTMHGISEEEFINYL